MAGLGTGAVRRVQIPRWLHAELGEQAAALGVSVGAYTARLLEEATGVRERPFAWRHVALERAASMRTIVDRPSRYAGVAAAVADSISEGVE